METKIFKYVKGKMVYIDKYKPESGWISVKERLPEPNKKVLVCLKYGGGKQEIKTSYYLDGKNRMLQ